MVMNVHQHEIQKFGSHAERWWDPQGELKTLHDINPLRMEFIQQHCILSKSKVVDVGCGGGILTEALSQAGAEALGIDLSQELIDVAELHALETANSARYQNISAEELAEQQERLFDVVTCMEMLEHVPNPESVITACAKLVKPGGKVFFSTLNRDPKAYLFAILGAEYIMNLLPKGTHNYNSFIKPAELSQMARQTGLELRSLCGISYHPFSKKFSLNKDVSVNYLAAFVRPE
jgi:2-polyprenyl-6-hydroxyphenyl methylase / 3-demethylubiquinone-9 3-methyltransferase